MKKLLTMLVMMTAFFSLSVQAGDFTIGKGTFLLNGEPFIVKAAEVHYPRIPRLIGSIVSVPARRLV